MRDLDQIDDGSYAEGKACFASGGSLRQIFELGAAAQTEAEEAKIFSLALGFADALVDHLRRR
jgi:hypothetical protein